MLLHMACSLPRSARAEAIRALGRAPGARALIASITHRCARTAVTSAWSYGGETSTTSMPTRSTCPTIWRIARSSSRESMPPASGVPVPGAIPGSTTSMSTDRYMQSGPSSASPIASAIDGLGAAVLDLDHRVPAQALLAHPVEGLLLGPVAAQAHLHEVRAGDPALLDQAAHRRAVAVQLAPLLGAGVGVGVEVHDADRARMTVARHGGRARIRDRVIAAEHDRDRARRSRRGRPSRGSRGGRVQAGRHDRRVAGVDDRQAARRARRRAGSTTRTRCSTPSAPCGSRAGRTGRRGATTRRRRAARPRSRRRRSAAARASSSVAHGSFSKDPRQSE